jgi:hypothetical protein
MVEGDHYAKEVVAEQLLFETQDQAEPACRMRSIRDQVAPEK